MNKKQSDALAKLRQESGFYKLSDLKAWSKKFKLPIVEAVGSIKGDHMAVFKRSYNPSYQVFISIDGKSTEITGI